jgi:hypothetical protein
MTDRKKLQLEIRLLGQTIHANVSVLASKVMSNEDRQSLQRQMAVRMDHQNLLQRRLDRLSPKPDQIAMVAALNSNLSRAGFPIGEQLVSRVPWPIFQERQARAHLVVGVLVEVAEAGHGDQLEIAQYVLKQLVSNQKTRRDYASTVAGDGGRPELYFAFDNEADARRFAAVLEAGTTDKYPGWASQRASDLNSAKLRALEASLPSPRRDTGKYPPAPQTPIRRYDEE